MAKLCWAVDFTAFFEACFLSLPEAGFLPVPDASEPDPRRFVFAFGFGLALLFRIDLNSFINSFA